MPQGYQMVVLAEPVLPDFKDERIQFPVNPADGAVLLGTSDR